jgi:hypothetical protein
MKFVNVNSDGCWMWGGYLNEDGYGQFSISRRMLKAHRVAYELFSGKIPPNLQIDHLCRNRSCVNPAHLEPVTSIENTRRGNSALTRSKKTHCPAGHPYDGDNLYRSPNGWSRQCKTCIRESKRRRRARAKEALVQLPTNEVDRLIESANSGGEA